MLINDIAFVKSEVLSGWVISKQSRVHLLTVKKSGNSLKCLPVFHISTIPHWGQTMFKLHVHGCSCAVQVQWLHNNRGSQRGRKGTACPLLPCLIRSLVLSSVCDRREKKQKEQDCRLNQFHELMFESGLCQTADYLIMLEYSVPVLKLLTNEMELVLHVF